jgi:hypothetical protein
MAVRLTCSCGTEITIRDADLARWTDCPRCGMVVYVPPEDGVQAGAPARAEPLPGGFEVADVPTRFRKAEARVRRRFLRGVYRGLGLCYPAAFLFLAGAGFGVLALILTLSARAFQWDNAAEVARVFYRTGGVVLALAGAAALSAAVCAVLGGPPRGFGLLNACAALTAVGLLLTVLLVLFPGHGPVLFLAGLFSLFFAWGSWMVFLRGLGAALGRQEATEGTDRVLWAAVRALLVALPTVLVLGFLVAAMVYRPILITFIPATFVAALVTIAWHMSGFESIPVLLLTPTAIPFIMDYVNFVGGLRKLIERRS